MRKKVIFIIIIMLILGGSIGSIYLISNLFNNDEYLSRVEFNMNGVVIDDFAYLLQNINKETVRNSKYDLIIMDYSSDGNETGEFSYSEVNDMKSTGDKKKFLISYVSIGEAENYRFYWEESWDANYDGIPDPGAPNWLDIENPDWEGNYKVKFWMIEWQQIIFNYLDRIITAGFDGIYMDIIDAYEFYQGVIPNNDWKMIDFVGNISSYVKNEASDNFSVFVQNADELLLNSTYLEHIDGIGREDLFYFDNIPTNDSWRNLGIFNLNKAIDNNKIVLITDYPQSASLKYDFYSNCITNGFLGYAADRELDSLKEFDLYPST
ncbi:MAG: MJ1477/TM1410 family putative glycoside hydrolase [Candidatus Lokiarchaeia archaeon]